MINTLDKVQKWSEYIQGDTELIEVKVHPRQEQFAKILITPRDFIPAYTLTASYDIPEFVMYLVYKDHTDIVVLG